MRVQTAGRAVHDRAQEAPLDLGRSCGAHLGPGVAEAQVLRDRRDTGLLQELDGPPPRFGC